MGVVRGFLVVTLFIVSGGFAVMGRRMLVMFSSFSVMFSSFVVHRNILFLEKCADSGGYSIPPNSPMEFYQGFRST
jgi:hypothetical protein